MAFSSFFFGRKQNSNNNRRSVKLNRNAVRTRTLSMEPLESRDLLTVTTGAIDDTEYSQIRAQYPDFNLPELQADLNVMTITPDDGALSLADLKSAITTAGTTQKPDLILIQTSSTANSVVYTSNADEISISINASQYGSVTIIGWGDERFTLDANQQSRVMTISGSSTIANLGGLTITNGSSRSSMSNTSAGGGIYNSSGTLTVSNSEISGNVSSDFGGGIYNLYGTFTVTNSTIAENTANSSGGGIWNDSGTLTVINSTISGNIASSSYHGNYGGGGIYNNLGSLTVTNSTISDNTAASGGGIYSSSSSSILAVINSTILDNTAKYDGGGMYSSGLNSILSVANSTIAGNTASSGGGIFSSGGPNSIFSITNSTILDNTASSGGGILNWYETLTVTNSTIAGNTASRGGGIYNYSSSTATNIYNSIIASNIATNDNDVYEIGPINGYNSLSSYTAWNNGSDNIVYDSSQPLFNDAKNGDYSLSPDSQAIDKGNNQYAYNAGIDETWTDLNGKSRFMSNCIDIGAYEFMRCATPVLDMPSVENDIVTVTWSSVDYASGYLFEYKLVTDSEWTSLTVPDISATFEYDPNQIYVVRIKTLGGNGFPDSSYSSEIPIINYTSVQETYPEFNLPESESDINIILVNLTAGDDLADLKNAIATAGTTEKPDLIFVLTSATANSVIYNSSADEISISVNASQYGSLTIIGWGEEKFTLDANQKSRVMTISGSSTIVNLGGLSITGGKSSSSMSNIFYGGGIYNSSGTLTVTNSEIFGNKASSAGGGIGNSGGTLIVTNSTISVNTASSGGGIYNTGSNSILTITNSEISRNTYSSFGGGIHNYTGSNSTFTVTNCTISGNAASGSSSTNGGGGIYNGIGGLNSTFTVTNSTISGNTASDGGGIYDVGTLIVTNSIVSRNYGGNVYRLLSSSSSNNLIGGYYPGFVCPPQFDSNGKLTNAETMDLRLRSDSVAIDKGNNTAAADIETDIDGNARFFGGIVDIGAYEYQGDRNDEPIPYSTVVNTLNDSFDLTDNEWSLREAIYYAPEYVTITFADNLEGTIVLTLGQLEIEAPLVIDGNNRITIDAVRKSRVFYVSAGTEESPVVLNSLAIKNGRASSGGGIWNDSGTLMVTNSTISGNTTTNGGGGGIANGGILTVANSTISGNTASSGGGIYSSSGSLMLTNSIVSKNYNGNIYGKISSNSSNNLIGGYYPGFVCPPQFDANGNLTNADTMDLHLRSDSIAIDKGDNAVAAVIETDIDGNARIFGGIVDIGAYEYQGDRNDEPIPYSTVVNTLNDSFDLTDNEWSLREAIYYAPDYVTITFADNLEGTIVLTLGQLEIEVPLVIDGDNRITIDADQKSRAFYVSAGTEEYPVVFNGLTIQNGKSSRDGGGIYNLYGTLTVTNSTIAGNTANNCNGGGIYNNAGILTIANSTISGNSASASYSSSGGGGIYNSSGSLIVTNTTISGNTANYSGGGIYNSGGTFTVTNSTISENTVSYYGGGIYNSSGFLTVINCEISRNTASSSGGGIYNVNYSSLSTITVINSTISGNTASRGGGIYNYSSSTAAINIYNSIIASNIATNGNDVYKNAGSINGYNSLSTYTAWDDGNDNIVYDESLQLFIDAENGNYHLIAGSQAIDKGNNAFAVDSEGIALAYDLDGVQRIVYGKVDIGAYEFDSRQRLTVPEFTLATDGSSVIVSISIVNNASSYTVGYQIDGSDSWTTITDVLGTTTSFVGAVGTKYNVKVQANGMGNYADSSYSESASIYIPIPLTGLTFSTDSPIVGTVLIASLTPSDATASYQWYCGSEVITNATESSFTVTEAQIGQTITCVATGTGDYTGSVSATTAVVHNQLDTPDNLILSVEGTTVTASWSAVENASGYTVYYSASGSGRGRTFSGTISTSANETTAIFACSSGYTYYVIVKANGSDDYYSDSAYSDPVSIYIPIPLTGLTLSTNSPQLGTVITASLTPSNATATYQWLSGDSIIEGSTGNSFTVTEAQIGQAITCVATGTGNYTGSVSATTAVVPLLPLGTPTAPTLTAEGTTITVSWSTVTNASSYTVGYQIDGSDSWTTITDVLGTTTSFVGAVGTKYNVKVQANGTGNYADSSYSESASIYIPIPLTGLTFSTDSPIVGSTITASLTPSDATASYQWYCGETIIIGAAESSFTVTEAQIGQTITCVATGIGDYAGSVSATTAVVPKLPLGTPTDITFTTEGITATVSWPSVEHASAYQFEYKLSTDSEWTVITIPDAPTTFECVPYQTYLVRVKALGDNNYTDSLYSSETTVVNYEAIREAYSEFDLPESENDINILVVDLTTGDNLADLKNAISTAGTTTLPDLILVKTSPSANSVVYTSSTDYVSINVDSSQYGSVTIVGWGEKNFTLNANKQSFVMNIVNSSTVFLGGLTIQNGKAGHGGGIYNLYGNLTVVNCTISGNSASSEGLDPSGGGIDNQGTLTVINSNISGNDASSRGGGIHTIGPLTVINSTISGNTASIGGGIDNINGGFETVTITNSTISGNTASGVNKYGGGIYNQGTLVVNNSTISENSSSGIYNQGSLTVIDSEILNNTTSSTGGGILQNGYGTITVTNSTISGNRAASGGGVYNIYGAVTLTNCTISENSASSGGGIYNSKTATVTNCEISGNTASSSGGGIYDSGTLTLTTSVISGNTASSSGGGIFDSGTLKVINSEISGNSTSDSNSSGGGIYNSSGSLTATNCTISGNAASGSSSSGGGIYNKSSSSIYFYNSIIACNTAVNGKDIYRNSGSINGYNSLSSYIAWNNGSDNIVYNSSQPLFMDVEVDDYSLSPDSQAIDKGNSQYAKNAGMDETWQDVSSQPRFMSNSIDIGAYEFKRCATPVLYSPSVEDGIVTVAWSGVQGAFGYQLEYKKSTDSEWTIKTVTDVSATFEYVPNQIHLVRIKALGADDIADSSYSSEMPIINYAVVRDAYPEFNLPDTDRDINILFVDLAAGDDLAVLKNAISTAGTTTLPDLILVLTSEVANSVAYTSNADEISVSIDSYRYGSVTIIGWGEEKFTLDANQKSRVMSISNSSAVVNLGGMSITGGKAGGSKSNSIYGGGIYNNGILTASNSELSDNNAEYGGGIYNSRIVTVANSTISGNVASISGGGIYSLGTLTLTASEISENTASSSGGGILSSGSNSSLTVINSEISRNTVSSSSSTYGGGIYNNYGSLSITNSSISGNTVSTSLSSFGGGIYNYYGTLTVTNSLISGNSVSSSSSSSSTLGGGIYNDGFNSTLSITNSTIFGNTTSSSLSSSIGGGIYISAGSVTVTNSVISGNSATASAGGIYNSSGTLTVTNSIVGRNYNGNFYASPFLVNFNNPIGNYYSTFVCPPQFDSNGNLTNADAIDMHLRSDSLIIDKGDSAAIADFETDLDDNPRIFGEAVDIGAYEYQGDRIDEPILYSTVVNTLNDSFDLTDDEWSLREAIYYAPEYVTITFADNLEGTIVLTLGQLEIEAPLAIDGDKRITIDADQKSRVFYVSGGTEEFPVVLNGLTIQNGSETVGGGIYNYFGCLTVTNSKISNNAASSLGGGIYNYGSNSTLTITNSEISRNTSLSNGGGIFNYRILTIANSTISGNTAYNGGGLYSNSSSATARVYNTIIACNTATNGNDVYKNGSFIYDYNSLSSYTAWDGGNDNIVYDPKLPLFIDAENGDYHLIASSQAIDMGNNAFAVDSEGIALAYDLDGSSRVVNGTVDMGAYESQKLAIPILTLTAEDTAITAFWSAVNNASSYTVMYQIDGTDNWSTIADIQGLTTSFVGIAGTKYNVKVQANGTGNYSDSEFSEAASITLVVPPTQLIGMTLSTSSLLVGSTITATLNPAGATATYQWYSGETPINGATESTFTVTEAQIGQPIVCIATGTNNYQGSVFAITDTVYGYNANDFQKTLAFLEQTDVNGIKNGAKLNVNYEPNNPTTWTGVNWTTVGNEKRISALSINGKSLVGGGDFSNMTSLTTLNCYSNQLTSLDVSGCTALQTLNCYSNQLTSLDVSNHTELLALNCNNNQLTSLDVSGCIKLNYSSGSGSGSGRTGSTSNTDFSITNNPLVSINLSGCIALTTFSYIGTSSSNTVLEILDASGCTSLQTLKCFYGQLTSLDVSECTALTYLDCGDNQLTSLDVSQNTTLTTLNCSSNQLTTLDVTNNTALNRLLCFSNQLSALDVSNNTALTSLNCSSNQLTSLDVSDCTTLTSLNCPNNQLTSLDVSQNTTLTTLNCSSNQLTTLDVTNNTALNQLLCHSNQLSALDVSNNTALTSLNCSSNQLTELNVLANTQLTSLYIGNNPELETVFLPKQAINKNNINLGGDWTIQTISGTTTSISNNYKPTEAPFMAINDTGSQTITFTSIATPTIEALTVEQYRITALWSTVENALHYTLEYQIEGIDGWTSITNIEGSSASFIGYPGNTYNVRVKAIGNNDYSDSYYSPLQTVIIADLDLSAQNDFVETMMNSPVLIDYRANDESTDWSLTTVQFGEASHGGYVVNEDGTIVYTPNEGFFGTDSVPYAIVSPSGKMSLGSITISIEPSVVPLDVPANFALSAEETTVIATWSAVTNASSYTVLYQIDGSDGWTTITGILGTTTSFVGAAGTKYNVKVQANGTGIYSDSEFSESASITLAVPPTVLSGLTLSTTTPEVGTIITATLDQTDATADYQWYCGTTIITGATESSFTVTQSQIGQTITCVATGTGNYTGSVSASTAVVPAMPLNTPTAPTLTAEDTTITATWSAVTNASSYTVMYQIDGADGWTTVAGILGTTTSFVGIPGTKYNVKVQTNGTGIYTDSSYSEATSITLAVPPVSLTGLTLSTDSPIVGSTITATLSPSDATVKYQWYCGSEIITGSTASSFTVTAAQIGQTITCVATGTGNYTGTVSATTAVVPALPLDMPNAPTLTVEGATITATWSAVNNASGYTMLYQIDGADGWTTVTDILGTTTSFIGMAGTTYNVKVQANGTGNYSDSSFSESSSITLAVPPTTLSGLTLSTDSPIVGTILTTTLSPSDATVEYQWYCGSEIITGATVSSFTVTAAQIGQTITCIATGTGNYTGSVSATTAVVPALPLGTPNAPLLTAEGATITATWSAVTNASSYTVEYQVDGSDGWFVITGINGTTVSFVGVAGTTYNVKVQANGTGNYSDSNYSESASITLAVPPTTLSGLTLSTDSPIVGTILTTTLSPSDATVEYQWFCGETAITGATESSFTVTEEQIGQTITCVATGTGNYTGTVSAATAVVPALALDTPDKPTLTVEDTTITATWSAVSNASSYTVEYQADGSDGWFVISGINGTTTSFIGTSGTTYNVRVQANGTGNYSDSSFSESSSITLAVSPTALNGLTLSTTTPEVGTVLTATLSPSDATVEYQWYCGSEIITGATASSFTVTEEQIGQTITCVATGTGNYTGTVSATTAVVPALPLGTPNAPSLTAEGTTITVEWLGVNNASSYTVQYQIDGADGWTTVTDILGTTTSFVGLAGTMYNVRVQANGAGNYSDSEFSKSSSITLAVPPTALTGLTLSTTTPEVGTTITAMLDQTGATADYQWYCGSEIITGSSASSFTVTAAQIGQTITCVATGTGNYTGSVSATTAVVPTLPLDTPNVPTLTVEDTTITATWSAINNASSYTVEYKFNSSDWLVLAITEETTALLIGQPGCEYSFRVKANGMSIYSDSDYSPIQTITTNDSVLVAQNDLVKTTLNNPVIIDYRENDNVMDWSLVSVQFGNALHGEYVVNEDGTIVYTPEDGFFGTDGFGYVLFSPSGKTSVGMIAIDVNLPITPSVQTSSSAHNPTSEMAASVENMTDWDNCYIELWAEGVNELNAGETTITLEYNPAVYAAPVLSDCAEGASLSVSQSVLLPNGNIQVELTAQVLESLSSQTDNLFLGTVVLSPSSEVGAGVEDVLAPEPVCVLDGVSLAPTVEAMPYDLIRNGSVDVNDFVAFATVFGLNPNNLSPDNPVYAQAVMADFNNDGIVNVDDFILFATNYGATKKTATIPMAQASTTADSGNSEWSDEIQQTQNEIAVFEPVYEEQIQKPLPVAASSAPLLISENKSESSMTILEAYSAALLDLYGNQERADLSGVSDVLAETRVDASVANYSDDNLRKTSNDVVDAVLEEDLLAIDWN